MVIVKLTKEQVKQLREMAGKTQLLAANDLHQKDSAFWRKYENGSRDMPSYYVELFCLKNNIKYPPFLDAGSLNLYNILIE